MKTTKDKIEKIVFDYTNTSMIDIEAIKDEIFDLIVEEKSKDNWISVNDKLPEYGTRAFAVCRRTTSYKIVDAIYHSDENRSTYSGYKKQSNWTEFNDSFPIIVTHWQPYPNNPMEGADPDKGDNYPFK